MKDKINKNKKKIKKIKFSPGEIFIIKLCAALCVVTAVYVSHFKHVVFEKPYLGFGEKFVLSFLDIFLHPLRIFPILPGTISTTFALSVVLMAVTAYLIVVRRMHEHDNDAVGPDKWMADEQLDNYNMRFTEPFGQVENDGKNNVIMAWDIRLSIDNERTRRNLHTFLIGGSGSGKSFGIVGPNLMQCNTSYVVTDPSGGLYKQYGKFLEYRGYKVKCFNLSRMDKGNHYNPFRYIHGDKDAAVLVNTLITNTTPPEASKGEPFWEKAETALLTALVAYLHQYCAYSQQNFSNVMRLLRAAQISEDDNTRRSPLDAIFEEIRALDPESFAVKQYDDFRMGAGKTLQSILISCAVRLQAFDLWDVAELTKTDDIDLEAVGDEKTALFIITPTSDTTFNFLAAMMYSQLFQLTYDYCETTASFTQVVLDGEGQVVKTFRADNEVESRARAKEAQRWLESAKNASIVYQKDMGWYELVMANGETAAFRGSKKEAQEALDLIKDGCVVANSERSNNGERLPIHVRMLLDEFANIGQIPRFENVVATSRKYDLSVVIILQSQAQIKKMYKYNWSDIAGNCDTLIYLGGGPDLETAEWMSKLLGKKANTVQNLSEGKGGGSTSYNRQGVELYSASQLRTMPEDECIVMVRGMPAYKGPKFPANKHKEWKLVKKLGAYYFSEEKTKYLYSLASHAEENMQHDAAQEEHGQAVENETITAAIDAEQEAAQQRAREYAANRDAEGDRLVSTPAPVPESSSPETTSWSSDDQAEDWSSKGESSMTSESAEARPAEAGPTTWVKSERDTSLDINDENWGLTEMIMGSAPADG